MNQTATGSTEKYTKKNKRQPSAISRQLSAKSRAGASSSTTAPRRAQRNTRRKPKPIKVEEQGQG